jgi:hypothetical protein
MNKYEMVIIASREARRLNALARNTGRELRRRPTLVAWDRLVGRQINHTYDPETTPETPPAHEETV